MTSWIQSPEAAALLASCTVRPPPRRLSLFRFQETAPCYVGHRLARLRRLYRLAEPAIDTPEWRAWLELDPQRAVIEAIARRSPPSMALPPAISDRNPARPSPPWPVTVA